MQPGADLADELRKVQDYSIKSEADAKAVCDVLARLAESPKAGGDSAMHAVVRLFQDVEGTECPAFSIMVAQGIPLLVDIVESALQEARLYDPDDLLLSLKILAMYGTQAGTDVVLHAACLPLRPESYMWSIVLRAYTKAHPERERLFRELSDPLPTGFLAVSLLDSANAAHQEGAEDVHPFDSPAGIRQIEQWLNDPDEDHYSYAVSSTAALAFIHHSQRDSLLAVALDHPSAEVQMEAAWAAAKFGREAGIRWLAHSCLDVNLSERAKRYLEELGHADAIPAESQDADFQAKAEFAQWLAHPNELGRPPDDLEIVDSRELVWPPDQERHGFWLVKYRVKDKTGLKEDDVGVGLVGSITFCLFSYVLEQRPPEDCYAIHCYWEMSSRGLIAETDIPEESTEYDHLIRQCQIDGLTDQKVVCVVELSLELKYPQQLVAVANATRQGESGWIVIDGPRSRWYAASEMPPDDRGKTIAMIHVGRVLLGFSEEPDRRRFLRPAAPRRSPDQIIATYERVLTKARSDARQAKKLLEGHSVLSSAFGDYVSALASVRSQPKAACACAAYEAILGAVAEADPAIHAEVLDSFSMLGEHFDEYVDALIESGRQGEIPGLIERFRPHWDHNLGYGRLGSAAFKSGHDELAESFIVRLRHSAKDWCRSEEMNALAEIWQRQGREEQARSLLIGAMKGLLDQSRAATGSDRRLFEQWFQNRRSAYLKLFPDQGNEDLRHHGIPSSTLGESP